MATKKAAKKAAKKSPTGKTHTSISAVTAAPEFDFKFGKVEQGLNREVYRGPDAKEKDTGSHSKACPHAAGACPHAEADCPF